MRILSWVLGVLALGMSVALAISWPRAVKAEKAAVAQQAEFAEAAEDWARHAVMQRYNARSGIENDELEIRNDDLEIEYAELKGDGAALTKARRARRLGQAKLDMDELELRLMEDVAQFGPSPEVREAKERAAACAESAKVYAGIIARDQNLAYAVGVLWLAFGFAAALAGKAGQKTQAAS